MKCLLAFILLASALATAAEPKKIWLIATNNQNVPDQPTMQAMTQAVAATHRFTIVNDAKQADYIFAILFWDADQDHVMTETAYLLPRSSYLGDDETTFWLWYAHELWKKQLRLQNTGKAADLLIQAFVSKYR
jgi:hypothetical protein